MSKYQIKATGRRVGAIGIVYPFTFTCEAGSRDEAISLMYNEWEHISRITTDVNVPDREGERRAEMRMEEYRA